MKVEQLNKTVNSVERDILENARKMLAEGTDAVTFSGHFFGPEGRLHELWTNQAERKALAESDLYKWLQDCLAELRRREAKAFSQEVERLSGRLTVVVPKSLHAALKREAAAEGVSLSGLIRLKLSIALEASLRLLGKHRSTKA